MVSWSAGFLAALAVVAGATSRDLGPPTVRTGGAVTARPACGYADRPRNLIVRSTKFPREPWHARASSPELLPRIDGDARTGPTGEADAVAVAFDTQGAPSPDRWSCLETEVDCTPGTTYTFSFSVRGPEGSFLTARGAAGAGFSRIPLNGRWQRVHLTEQASVRTPKVRIGLGAHRPDEAPASRSVEVLLAAPQLVAGRGVVPYEPSGESAPPEWPLELVPAGAFRRPCGTAECGEGTATNLLCWSTKLDQRPWTSAGLEAMPKSHGPSPTGMRDAHRLLESKVPGPHRIEQSFRRTASGPVTASIYVKPESRMAAMLAVSAGDSRAEARFGLSGAGTVDAPSGGIERVGHGWYRLTLSVDASSPGDGTFSFTLLDRPDGGPDYVGEGSGLLAWGPQVELGALATCHIPTFFVPETRAADEPVTPPAPR